MYHIDRHKIKRINTLTLIITGVILLLGIVSFVMLYSAAGGNINPWAKQQFYAFIFFYCVMLIVSLFSVGISYESAYYIYFACLLLLIVAEVAGHNAMGAQRWLHIGGINIQPSEIMKIGVILTLARYFSMTTFLETRKLVPIIIPILIVAAPVILILKQPNLGTAIVIILISASIFFIAGVRTIVFVMPIIIAVCSAPFIWHSLYDYQKRRIMVFLGAEKDFLGAGYNIAQSKIAIGAGGAYGRGLLHGTQSQLSFLPEKHTDFIFTLLAEEWGFRGVLFVLLCYGILLISCYKIAINNTSTFDKAVVVGVASMIFTHLFINIGMISGLLPVVGMPLPLLSYGRSNLATTLIGIGLVLGVHRRNT